MAIVKHILCLLFLILTAQSWSQPVDSVARILQRPVAVCVYGKHKEIFAIAGTDSSMIYRLKKKQIVFLSEKLKSAHVPHFNKLLYIKQNVILVGTTNNYLFCFRRYRWVQINRLHGLTDSCITALEWDKDNKMILVQTLSARFVLMMDDNRISLKKVYPVAEEKAVVDRSLFNRYFRRPIQKAICNSVSNIDLSGRKRKYISNNDLQAIKKQLKPGDILLKHNDDQLINIGIPGMWSHSAIYIGGEREINEYFEGIEMLGAISPFEYIKYHYPDIKFLIRNRRYLIIEAIGEGVVINSLQHCASVDCFVAFRPQLAREALFQCLLTAFDNYRKPYDFLFNFETDDALVCSELVYKSFRKTATKDGIEFQMGSLAGSAFLSPNDIAIQFCNQKNSPSASMKMVLFYNGNSRLKTAREENQDEFCSLLNR